jgi:2'-5' RNA ligase
MRAFIAVEISEEVRDAVRLLVSELRKFVQGARWIPPENLHMTLRFLGEADEKRLREMSIELEATAARFAPFRLELRGLTPLPNRRPRVLCVAVSNPPDEIQGLHEQIEGVVRKHGFPPEERGFKPHLTFARFRKPEKELRLMESGFEDRVVGAFRVDDVVLFRSTLKPSGAVYDAMARFPLANKGMKAAPS